MVSPYGWMSKLWSFFLGALNIRCRTITGTQKGTIILITAHMDLRVWSLGFGV